MRLGTGAREGDPMKAPSVVSHLPGQTEYASFPKGVDACLQDTTPPATQPPTCNPVPPDSGTPPEADICAFTPVAWQSIPANVCTNPQPYIHGMASDPAQVTFLTDYLQFFCSPVSLEQSWAGSMVVSHVVDLSDKTVVNELGRLMQEAVNAYVPEESPPTDADRALAGATIKKFFEFNVCDSSARLMTPTEVFGATSSSPTTPPDATPAGSCL